MPPSDYVNTYMQLVCYVDDVTPYTTPIRNYLQAGLDDKSKRADAAHIKLLQALPKLLGLAKNKHVPTIFEFEDETYLTSSIWRVYHGKGAPNEIQDTLYLAGRCGIINGGNLLDYADKNLGVDCGGFVANFWGMGRPDETTPTPYGYQGYKPRTIWDTYRSFRRKDQGSVQVGDAAIFFSGTKDNNPDIVAAAKQGGGYVEGSGSQAFHIGLVNDIKAVNGVEDATIQIVQSSGQKAQSGGGNGVDVRPKTHIKMKIAHGLVYAESDKNRIYFVGRPNAAPSYPDNDWG